MALPCSHTLADSGEIDKEEFGKFYADQGLVLLPEEIDDVFPLFDTDNNGSIDFIEFQEFIAMHKSKFEVAALTAEIDPTHLDQLSKTQVINNE